MEEEEQSERSADDAMMTMIAVRESSLTTTTSATTAMPLPWYKDTLQVTAMISNFSTSYNVVNISLVLAILKQLEHTALLSAESASESSSTITATTTTTDATTTSTSSAVDAAAVASALLAGMMVGQVLGGLLGDLLGRMNALLTVMTLQIVASLASGMVVWNTSSSDASNSSSENAANMYAALAFWRFILGVGAGGVYPLAAVLSAEKRQHQQEQQHQRNESNDSSHNASVDKKLDSVHRVVLTFSTQGLGFWTAPAITLLLLYVCPLQYAWRIVLALGSVPGMVVGIMQWSIHRRSTTNVGHEILATTEQIEDERDFEEQDGIVESSTAQPNDHQNNNENDEEEQVILHSEPDGLIRCGDSSEEQDVTQQLQQQQQQSGWWGAIRSEEHLLQKLLGTAGTWFLFDVLFYGNTLFQPIVLEAAFGAHAGLSSLQQLRQTAFESLLVNTIALPGYAIAGSLIGKKTCGLQQTPRYVMLQGFAAMSILYLSIGLYWDALRHCPSVLLCLYASTFLFANYGPNTTTFILPSLVYSERCRSTLNGISAACGKLGALVGAMLFAPAAQEWGHDVVMILCAGIALVAFAMTVLFV